MWCSAGSREHVCRVWASTSQILPLRTTLGLCYFPVSKASAALSISQHLIEKRYPPPPKKKPVCALLFQQAAKNPCKKPHFWGWRTHPGASLCSGEREAAEAERSLPKLGGQMAFPWLTASLAGAAGVVVGKDAPDGFWPFPALFSHGINQDPASSPGEIQGGTCPKLPLLLVYLLSVSPIYLPSRFAGGKLTYFYCHCIYRTVPPSLLHPCGATRSQALGILPIPKALAPLLGIFLRFPSITS